jgi:DNA repair protein RecN (Recombination protein N)
MLTSLAIHNVVLIDRLELRGEKGLAALTGETGAGKSILLDALGLALGGRADAGMVRHGEPQASVSAAFELPPRHPALLRAAERGLATDDNTLILRRALTAEGRSKAFINDAPVTVQALRDIGEHLVEIHGQFETQGLLDPATHREALDSFAGLGGETAKVRALWQDVRDARQALANAEAEAAAARQQQDYLTYTVGELDRLAPEEGEEDTLAEKRQRLLARQKVAGALDGARGIIDGDAGIVTLIDRLQAQLARLATGEDDLLKPVHDAVARAKSEIEDASWQLDRIDHGGGGEDGRLEDIEDRYFALRAAAKKHNTTGDGLVELHAALAEKLRLITHNDEALADRAAAVARAEAAYLAAARGLSAKRKAAAAKLTKAVNAELPDLKLDKARVHVEVSADAQHITADGIDTVQFLIATNPQTPPAPLNKIASGGELSRFMLALKVILAEGGSVPTLIFDEADSGIGGATADAVGERLQRLAAKYQVLAVTHSPQVAARAQHHWHVAKLAEGRGKKDAPVITRITPLATREARAEEIARMLSGAEITTEARAQALRLLEKTAKADAA